MNGATCGAASECGSGFCVDGVCCDRSCDAQCEACDATPGKCSTIAGAPHGSRPACADATDVCKKLACTGTNATGCGFANTASTICAPAHCASDSWTGPSTCDGAGGCGAPTPVSCVPYVCETSGCRTACAEDAQCAGGFVCVRGICVVKTGTGASCSADQLSSVSKDGLATSCGAYRCRSDGVCHLSCASTEECAPGYLCDSTSRACTAPSPSSEDEGGCAMPRGAPSRGTSVGAALALLALVLRRRGARRASTKHRGHRTSTAA
jgi:hypothetical protein